MSRSRRNNLKYVFKSGGKDDQLAVGLPGPIYLQEATWQRGMLSPLIDIYQDRNGASNQQYIARVNIYNRSRVVVRRK